MAKNAQNQPDRTADSISIPTRLHTKNVSVSRFQPRFDRKPEELYDPTPNAIKNQPKRTDWNKNGATMLVAPFALLVRFGLTQSSSSDSAS
ncbi:hypothetical protein ACEUAC_00680 [Aeromonas veronii]|uniref:hypothetical protein n=1 Tax=Aeromonas veronii TaxID=654 RepID=UPI001D0AD6E3|nr:hypothetical protein [Aeromonas veronii]MCC0089144.1 hypothetical protein [Aeromonas veronii]